MRIVVAMSGGVDSSAAAALLKEQGHEVIGMTLRVWSYESQAQCGSCCSPDDIDDARRVAEALDIPFYVAGVEELFKEQVVQPFVRDYLQGRTPIPCVACNRDVKFNFLLRRARALGAKLATGHYARVETHAGIHRLFCGEDVAKDQSYFLFTLGQDELSDLLFPVGHLSKPEVRAIAERHGLTTSSKPESMEICFVPDGDHGRFVEKVAGPQPGGDVVDARGKVLGRHAGVHRYTVGQRRGLHLGGTAVPLYVQRVDAEKQQVVVGPVEDLSCTGFDIIGSRWVSSPPASDQTVRVRIRHRHGGAEARIRVGEAGRSHVALLEPARAVTPGQAAVFYRGDEVLGGGWIA